MVNSPDDTTASDIEQLSIMNEAIRKTSPSMRRAALEYLWNRWLTQPALAARADKGGG